jgi:predicted RNA-binding protein YlqC (UPF0109 family)
MKELLAKVVSGFVDHPKDVQVEEKTDDYGGTVLALSVNPEDMGKVIGKGGKIAKSLRLMLRIPAIRQGKKINLEIVETGTPQ